MYLLRTYFFYDREKYDYSNIELRSRITTTNDGSNFNTQAYFEERRELIDKQSIASKETIYNAVLLDLQYSLDNLAYEIKSEPTSETEIKPKILYLKNTNNNISFKYKDEKGETITKSIQQSSLNDNAFNRTGMHYLSGKELNRLNTWLPQILDQLDCRPKDLSPAHTLLTNIIATVKRRIEKLGPNESRDQVYQDCAEVLMLARAVLHDPTNKKLHEKIQLFSKKLSGTADLCWHILSWVIFLLFLAIVIASVAIIIAHTFGAPLLLVPLLAPWFTILCNVMPAFFATLFFTMTNIIAPSMIGFGYLNYIREQSLSDVLAELSGTTLGKSLEAYRPAEPGLSLSLFKMAENLFGGPGVTQSSQKVKYNTKTDPTNPPLYVSDIKTVPKR